MRYYLPMMRASSVLVIFLLIFVAYNAFPTEAYSANGVPIRALVLVDEGNPHGDNSSELFERIQRILNLNKIPYEILDISQIDKDTFLDSSSNLRYSVLLVLCSGWKIDLTDSQLILEATHEGMGVVGLAPDSANMDLMSLFGINELGTTWLSSHGIKIIKDEFTFSYEGQSIAEPFQYIDHHLLDGAEVIAVFSDSGAPAIWAYRYGSGKVVFHNNDAYTNLYHGILLQSILYAMPIGVACPVNSGAIYVDDCPRAFRTDEETQEWHYNFYSNFQEWLQTYNLTASFFVAFSYSGNISDFWQYPESLEATNDIVKSGYELGLHCGSKHTPLKVGYWGSEAAIDTEIDEMMGALGLLRSRLYDTYGTYLGEAVSYAAPDNLIGDYGYEVLDARTDIKYVGTTGLPDEYRTVRDFGWEGDLNIYNLPRMQGGFYIFNQPHVHKDYSYVWSLLRSIVESGDAYLIFTHPDELDLLDTSIYAHPTMSELFEALTVWADYISSHYPFYRWWTAAELGDYLDTRAGTLDAKWLPKANTLELRLSQPDDAIHIKTHLYLQKIAQKAETLNLVLSSVPYDLQSDDYDIINVGHDYFIYPKSLKSPMPVKPEVPFSFKHTSMPTTESQNTPDDNTVLPLPALLCIAAAFVILIAGGVIVHKIRKE